MRTATTIVCTVFERNYHHGVVALANSLFTSGFRGVLHAGYRGPLPPWVKDGAPVGPDYTEFEVASGLYIHFAPLATDEMLANVKPQLINQVWDNYGPDVETVFYIDCDIVIKAQWKRFEEWARFGVALVEDMNSPVAVDHLLRQQWRQYYGQFGIDYVARDNVYVNGGFVGLHRDFRDFNALWDQLQIHMKQYTGKQDRIGIADRWNLFHFMDQDALNVAKDLYSRVSLLGKEAMDFDKFGQVMSHAAGPRKPWHKSYLKNVLSTGSRPTPTDKTYWKHVAAPIRLFSDGTIRRKTLAMQVATMIGRFFTRT